uniref:Uncharacterized protein n=1 Tax=Anguilla anguilla TaxID=7936 RepID=A0A0E9TVI7_ANGAN
METQALVHPAYLSLLGGHMTYLYNVYQFSFIRI